MSVMPLQGEQKGVVVSHKEISEVIKVQNALQDALSEIEDLKNRLEQENEYLREEIQLEHNFADIIGHSRPLKQALQKVEKVAPLDTTVLLLGETGTGKELFARAVHNRSARQDRPLVKVNCATLPANLIESELFGHERGAFTGALQKRVGRFELASGGTIFLDEIGELPLDLQAKLLRVLQEGEFERLGNPRTITVDVRVLAATNRNLEAEVRQGNFRQDLYYRLSVYTIPLPPLRERKDDIPLIVDAVVERLGKKLGRPIKTIPQKAMDALQEYSWPGNVRELENVIERAIINSPDQTLRVELPRRSAIELEDQKTLEDVERDYIVRILTKTKWRIAGSQGAAAILGLNPSTLRSRIQKLDIQKPWA
jgi:transcriptional regulator with GAF, ATPase, and Fis domain